MYLFVCTSSGRRMGQLEQTDRQAWRDQQQLHDVRISCHTEGQHDQRVCTKCSRSVSYRSRRTAQRRHRERDGGGSNKCSHDPPPDSAFSHFNPGHFCSSPFRKIPCNSTLSSVTRSPKFSLAFAISVKLQAPSQHSHLKTLLHQS
jgi:hypothetical protein